jgi:diadenosine tetraphosphatase ApaH/serine/threonine PP2A family protein phosphatase
MLLTITTTHRPATDLGFLLHKKLRGRDVQVSHGLAETLDQLEPETPEFRTRVADFLDDLVSHFVLDDGHLVVAHAGLKAEMQGRASGKVRSFALYGETTGETDEFGLPVRYKWAAEYRGSAHVVYGHTPIPEPEWLNRTINIDTGCVFGGSSLRSGGPRERSCRCRLRGRTPNQRGRFYQRRAHLRCRSSSARTTCSILLT